MSLSRTALSILTGNEQREAFAGLVMGMGVGIMCRVWRGTRSSCVVISSLCALYPLFSGVGVGVTLGGVWGLHWGKVWGFVGCFVENFLEVAE